MQLTYDLTDEQYKKGESVTQASFGVGVEAWLAEQLDRIVSGLVVEYDNALVAKMYSAYKDAPEESRAAAAIAAVEVEAAKIERALPVK